MFESSIHNFDIFFDSLSFKVPLKIQVYLRKKKTFESLFGKESSG